MKLTRSFLALAVCFSLSLTAFSTLPIQSVEAQDSKIALHRGYRTGYSDGYMAGYRDTIDSQTKSYARHSEYDKADRAYNSDYGTVEDYRDGYKHGFETGYDTGFEKRSFEATVPANIGRRGTAPVTATITQPVVTETIPTTTETTVPAAPETAVSTPASTDTIQSTTQPPVSEDVVRNANFQPVSDAVIIIPRDTELIVELIDAMGTEQSREGDKFLARIVSPAEITGAIIEGRVNKIMKPGRIKRRSELSLSFDRILLNDKRWSNFSAALVEVLPAKGDNVKKVDDEGTAVGKHSYKEDALKVGAATGTGVAVGAIAGGPVGAAVGAGVGAAFGVGAVVIERGKHINLSKSQQLRIKSSYEIQIR